MIRLRRNFGQTAALSAGFRRSARANHRGHGRGPAARPGGPAGAGHKIEEGYDIASGWRKERDDNAVLRKIPSRIANWMMAQVSGVELHDFGTTYKAYRAEILKEVNLYGELHRFIPALASYLRRPHRRGADRQPAARGRGVALRDRADVQRLLRHSDDPFPAALPDAADAFLRAHRAARARRRAWGFSHSCWWKRSSASDIIAEHGPLLFAGGILLGLGMMMFTTGLLGEIMMRTYFESQGRRIYAVRQVLSRQETGADEGQR